MSKWLKIDSIDPVKVTDGCGVDDTEITYSILVEGAEAELAVPFGTYLAIAEGDPVFFKSPQGTVLGIGLAPKRDSSFKSDTKEFMERFNKALSYLDHPTTTSSKSPKDIYKETLDSFKKKYSDMASKDPSQTAKSDSGKPDIYLVPPEIIEAIAKVRMYGNEKYHDPDNWKTVAESRYFSALMRHLITWRKAKDNPDLYSAVDEESGIDHLWHAACNLAFMISMEEQKKKEVNK